ncbi:hypothetical protein PALB_15310 [Pseudoalteromonas luteoviolacea B = ATCC 29581]|nr:hypothetical protein PALB_15310 [Pseudoalteromonas luteoviolacea B = ATCC 29581]
MNQAILFNDDAKYNESEQRIVFTAMSMGMLVPCFIGCTFDNNQDAMTHFEKYRFDYEIQAEEKLEAELFTASGEIELSFIP